VIAKLEELKQLLLNVDLNLRARSSK